MQQASKKGQNMDMGMGQVCKSGDIIPWYYRDVRDKLENTKFKTMAEVKDLLKKVLLFAESRERSSCESIEWQIAKRQEAEKRLEDYKKDQKLYFAGELVFSHKALAQGMAGVAIASEKMAKLISELP